MLTIDYKSEDVEIKSGGGIGDTCIKINGKEVMCKKLILTIDGGHYPILELDLLQRRDNAL